jgi:predicted membrane protein
MSNRLFFGVLALIAGVLIFINNFELMDTGGIWEWWPTLLILLGIWNMVKNGFQDLIFPFILIFLGAYWQLMAFDVIEGDFLGKAFLPLILLLIALQLIFRAPTDQKTREKIKAFQNTEKNLNIVQVFGGSEENVDTKDLKGGEIVTIFGGNTINLSNAKIDETPAIINVVNLFGGTELIVPAEWSVKNEAVTIFGASEDSRKKNEKRNSDPDLVLTGIVMFGGVEIK